MDEARGPRSIRRFLKKIWREMVKVQQDTEKRGGRDVERY